MWHYGRCIPKNIVNLVLYMSYHKILKSTYKNFIFPYKIFNMEYTFNTFNLLQKRENITKKILVVFTSNFLYIFHSIIFLFSSKMVIIPSRNKNSSIGKTFLHPQAFSSQPSKPNSNACSYSLQIFTNKFDILYQLIIR